MFDYKGQVWYNIPVVKNYSSLTHDPSPQGGLAVPPDGSFPLLGTQKVAEERERFIIKITS